MHVPILAPKRGGGFGCSPSHEIQQRDQTILDLGKALQKSSRTPAEEYHYGLAKVALDELGQNGRTVLRHLWNHESLTFNGIPPPLPVGMNPQETQRYLSMCVDKGLVTRETTPKPSGGVDPVTVTTFRIAPGMKVALGELLYP